MQEAADLWAVIVQCLTQAAHWRGSVQLVNNEETQTATF